MRVLYFGTYEREYPRNAQVISCLRGAGVDVIEHHVPVWEGQRHKFGIGLKAMARLAAAELRLLRRPRAEFDALIVGYPGHFDLRLARRAAGGRPVIFNPLLSLFDSLILDRGRWSEKSVPSQLLRSIDKHAMRLADVTIADTDVHADFFAELAGVARDRIEVCFLGAEERLFRPVWKPPKAFHCLFFGKLIPLHGIDTILEAIRLTPEIRYRLLGSGQGDHLLEHNLPENAEWVRWVDRERIPDELGAAGCSLGIFGTTEKARRVIPNKAYEALACGTPLITSDTPAARELMVDGENALLVQPGDASALAFAIRRVRESPSLAMRISEGGLATFKAHASEDTLGLRWRGLIERLI